MRSGIALQFSTRRGLEREVAHGQDEAKVAFYWGLKQLVGWVEVAPSVESWCGVWLSVEGLGGMGMGQPLAAGERPKHWTHMQFPLRQHRDQLHAFSCVASAGFAKMLGREQLSGSWV